MAEDNKRHYCVTDVDNNTKRYYKSYETALSYFNSLADDNKHCTILDMISNEILDEKNISVIEDDTVEVIDTTEDIEEIKEPEDNYEEEIPNEQTIKAIEEAGEISKDENVKTYDNVEEIEQEIMKEEADTNEPIIESNAVAIDKDEPVEQSTPSSENVTKVEKIIAKDIKDKTDKIKAIKPIKAFGAAKYNKYNNK